MTEFKIVEIIARRFRNGKEEVQVQWGVTWETVDAEFAKGQLYKEFMEDLQKEEQTAGEKKACECVQLILRYGQDEIVGQRVSRVASAKMRRRGQAKQFLQV